MLRVLFVCMGNICRSPMAEGVFRHQANAAGIRDGLLHHLFIDSAGTTGYHTGESPDPRAQQTALKYGIDISELRARQVTRQDFADFDYLLAMDRENLKNLQRMGDPAHHHKVRLFMDFAENCPGITEVDDPYYGGAEGFERVFDIINRGAEGFLKYLQENHDFK
ncbi:low molecular weight protein-tyrosine-phosphatase [Emcibacter nanhaiensis]|uniref:protein-tyrosine-phosphatase n=1 Tax=Emcibacter nanhaiensis TaxID=1505037 RepID=A0A501PAZ1_9PROT|nr:low molecular weight protein-tyrosine-phosphatase [Emcibacter nanhaiensis]TPD57358.1 low molecular weight phosphotyrosine protein phosphatase [Emcibacter nanhaiensis]